MTHRSGYKSLLFDWFYTYSNNYFVDRFSNYEFVDACYQIYVLELHHRLSAERTVCSALDNRR